MRWFWLWVGAVGGAAAASFGMIVFIAWVFKDAE